MSEQNPNARFQVVDSPDLLPACDFITRSVVGPFIDTGKHVRFEEGKFQNRVYLCEETVREMAEALGLFDEYRNRGAQQYDEGYAIGYAEGVKEDFDGDLADAADILDRLAGTLRGGLSSVSDVVEEPAGADLPAATNDRRTRKSRR